MNYGLTVVDDDVDSARDPDRYVIYLDRTIDRDARDAISSADKMFPSTRARARAGEDRQCNETRFLHHCLELFHAGRDLHC